MNAEQKKFRKVIKARRKKESKDRVRSAEMLRLKRRAGAIRRARKAAWEEHKKKQEQESSKPGLLRRFFK